LDSAYKTLLRYSIFKSFSAFHVANDHNVQGAIRITLDDYDYDYKEVINRLVWRSNKGLLCTNEVKLRRARLVVGLVTTFGRSTILVFIQAIKPGHPSVGRCNNYWFQSSLGKNGASDVM